MYTVYYSKQTGKIVAVHPIKKLAGMEPDPKLNAAYDSFVTTNPEIHIALKIYQHKIKWDKYVVDVVNKKFTLAVEMPKIQQVNKIVRRQRFFRIDKNNTIPEVEAEMVISFQQKDRLLSIYFHDMIEYDLSKRIWLFFTEINDPTIFLEKIEFPISRSLFQCNVKTDISKCSIYSIRHFSKIKYIEELNENKC